MSGQSALTISSPSTVQNAPVSQTTTPAAAKPVASAQPALAGGLTEAEIKLALKRDYHEALYGLGVWCERQLKRTRAAGGAGT